jgi:hypothetical protein
LENPEGQSHKGKCEHEVTKDSTDHSSCMANMVDKYDKTYKCSALDCQRNYSFASLAILCRHTVRQRSTECITQARSYTTLFQPASAIIGKASRSKQETTLLVSVIKWTITLHDHRRINFNIINRREYNRYKLILLSNQDGQMLLAWLIITHFLKLVVKMDSCDYYKNR